MKAKIAQVTVYFMPGAVDSDDRMSNTTIRCEYAIQLFVLIMAFSEEMPKAGPQEALLLF
jgi:hypothetical protein